MPSRFCGDGGEGKLQDVPNWDSSSGEEVRIDAESDTRSQDSQRIATGLTLPSRFCGSIAGCQLQRRRTSKAKALDAAALCSVCAVMAPRLASGALQAQAKQLFALLLSII